MKDKKLSSLNDPVGYDVIVNCLGLVAGKLVNDENIRPARSQMVLVRAPWIKHFVINDKRDKLTYVLPRTDSVMLGGTTQVGNWDKIVNPDTAEFVMSRCVSLIPSVWGGGDRRLGWRGTRCGIL